MSRSRRKSFNMSEAWIYDPRLDNRTGGWIHLDDPKNSSSAPRRFHTAVTFRNGPTYGTVWVCGGEIYVFNKILKKFFWEYTNTCECYNSYYERWNKCPTLRNVDILLKYLIDKTHTSLNRRIT